MTLRRIGAAGLALALLGCSNDATSKALVDDLATAPAVEVKPTSLLARADEPKVEKDPVKAAAAFKKGMDAANAGRLEDGIKNLDEALKFDPDNKQFALMYGLMTQYQANRTKDEKAKYAMFRRSAEVARKLKDGDKPLGAQEQGLLSQALYNEACAYALEKQPDKAMASLVEAIDSGFEDVDTMSGDKDLDSIRSRPEFAKLSQKIADARSNKVRKEMKDFKPFPFSFELPDLEGKPVKLADFKGKVTIVDVWGTWCPPCKMEIPHFVALKDKYKDLAIVGINYEHVAKDKVKDTIASFVKENKINYPCVIGDDKTQEKIPDLEGFPTTLFLDREGKVRYKHVGYAPMAQLEEIVKTLLADKP
jgi:thiol-disulfide isomerase/thioredoxin